MQNGARVCGVGSRDSVGLTPRMTCLQHPPVECALLRAVEVLDKNGSFLFCSADVGGGHTSRSTGRSGRQKAATRRNMRREERVTVQGPVKQQQPDGMSHRGGRFIGVALRGLRMIASPFGDRGTMPHDAVLCGVGQAVRARAPRLQSAGSAAKPAPSDRRPLPSRPPPPLNKPSSRPTRDRPAEEQSAEGSRPNNARMLRSGATGQGVCAAHKHGAEPADGGWGRGAGVSEQGAGAVALSRGREGMALGRRRTQNRNETPPSQRPWALPCHSAMLRDGGGMKGTSCRTALAPRAMPVAAFLGRI